MYTCRECEREINQATEICPYCGTDLTESAVAGVEPQRKRSLFGLVLRWGVLLAALGGFLWYLLPERRGPQVARAEEQAVEALKEVWSALGAYARAQGGSYPGSLEALADHVRASAQRALREGYQLQYTPGPVEGDGRVRNYVLLARPGNYGYRNFFADETGVIRATRENRPATAQDPPI